MFLIYCLQVLDDGQLTDGQGRRVDFKNTVLVMTSNLGSQEIQQLSEEHDYGAMKEMVMEVVGQHFRPEFINRIDESVVFHPLEKTQISSIAEIQLQRLSSRLKDRELALSYSQEALHKLVDLGYDPVFGARPLKRAIQQWIENPLAQHILQGQFSAGDTIHVEVGSGAFVFTRALG